MTGLRGRTAAALALVSVVTLVIVALALLIPLERQLRNDEVETLAQAGRDNVAILERVPSDAFVRPGEQLQRALRGVRRATRGDVAVVDGAGRVVATTDPDAREQFPDAAAAARTGRSSRGIEGVDAESEARAAVALEVEGARYGLALRKPLDDAREAARVVRRRFEIAAVISLAVALLLGSTLSAGLAQRLRRLRDTTLRVAEIGPFAEVQADARRDEIGDLTRAFAEMQDRLREQEQARKSFVATASHELRTPLASLLVMLDLLRGDLDDPTDVGDARLQAERAEAQAERLSALAAELLDLSRLDARVPLASELVDLNEAVSSIIAEFDDAGRGADVCLVVGDGPGGWAVADPRAVSQTLRILTDNALRHSPPGTTVSFAVALRAGGVAVVISDQGPGVPAIDRARIFARFERGSTATAATGFGLGLAIGRELARQMRGDLLYEETDGGARFALVLPAAPAALDA